MGATLTSPGLPAAAPVAAVPVLTHWLSVIGGALSELADVAMVLVELVAARLR